MPEGVMVAVVLSVGMVASTWLISRTLSKLNIVIATSGASEGEAVSEQDLEQMRRDLEGGGELSNNEPAAENQWTYESAAKVLEGDLY